MSFNRAPIKRFNETTDASIPPPGAYDPKFMTDVAFVSSPKPAVEKRRVASRSPAGTHGLGMTRLRSRSTSKGALSEGNQIRRNTSRFTFQNQVGESISKESAFYTTPRIASASGLTNKTRESIMEHCRRRRSTTRVPIGNLSKLNPITHETNVTKSPNNNRMHRCPSHSTNLSVKWQGKTFADVFKDQTEGIWISPRNEREQKSDQFYDKGSHDQELTSTDYAFSPLSPTESKTSIPHRPISRVSSNDTLTPTLRHNPPPSSIFDEIQSLAESLQSELTDYKMKLNKELHHSQELEAKKLELEFVNHTLKRQLERLESQKEIWEMTEKAHCDTVNDIMKQKQITEEKLKHLEQEFRELKESKQALENTIAQQTDEKCKWENVVEVYEDRITQLQRSLREEECKRAAVEERIRDLELQIDSTYHTCEARLADNETTKEKYEVQIQEMREQVNQLQMKLEEKSRELDTQKTLMDILRAEKQDKLQLADEVSLLLDGGNDQEIESQQGQGEQSKLEDTMHNYIS